jgi:biotin synthase
LDAPASCDDVLRAFRQTVPAREVLTDYLKTHDPSVAEFLREAAERTLLDHCGSKVFYRGLVEFSNRCALDCLYCGIRRSNGAVERYTVSEDAIVEAARWCADAHYGSVVLQSGERRDDEFVSLVEKVVGRIRKETVSSVLPRGLGVTLCVGEQSPEAYRRFRDAGAHRYLLRIETTNEDLFNEIHPDGQRLETRLESLAHLRQADFQVGTGVMIGLPGQTAEMLADDLLFYVKHDFDMYGMGPFIPHPDTPMGGAQVMDDAARTRLGLRMIALTRLLTVNTNIAATTALQALDPIGREKGLAHGANVLMPQLTPVEFRKNYLLYRDKPCVDENREDCLECLKRRVEITGRTVALDEWGDSLHFHSRKNLQPAG